ncbi:MAG: amidohydrolase [Actinomycetota bacterium]
MPTPLHHLNTSDPRFDDVAETAESWLPEMESSEQVIYPAKLVRTLDPARPSAEAIMVRGSRIRAIGSLDELRAYGPSRIDDRYADSVIFPGMVEAHAHAKSGGMWEQTYIGYYTRKGPDGTVWTGCKSIEEVQDRLREADSKLADGEILRAWGLDPIFFPGDRLDRTHLDEVSNTRPIFVMHQSGHLATINSEMLSQEGIDRDCPVEGVVKDSAGEPTGELQEPPAIALVKSATSVLGGEFSASALQNFGADACNHGVTTAADLGNPYLFTDDLEAHREIIDDESYPVRLSLFHRGGGMGGNGDAADEAARLADLTSTSSDKVHLGGVKLFLDGSIQGFTARLQDPGYIAGDDNGIWLSSPEQFYPAFRAYHAAGALVHVHCNGDEATELYLDTVEQVLQEVPRWDHRHTVTHSQLSTPAQYRRMKALGMCANIFSNHIWYWGDQHRDLILGPDRAERMDAAATALRIGVPISFHCDTPITPLDPLATASYAAERATPSGRILGEHERISVPDALDAVTIGAAYMLKLDHLVGSLESGKFADFAILDRDPYECEPAELREITVRGTVVAGRHFSAVG